MSRGKAGLVIVFAFILAVGGLVFYAFRNISAIVEAAIEKYGSRVIGVNVDVSAVRIRPSSGEGSISGLTVANPPGFSSPHIFTLDDISVRLMPDSVAKSPIVIDEIRVSRPEVFYEMNSRGRSNLDVIRKKIETAAGRKPSPERNGQDKEVRLLIRRLVFENGKVHASAPSLAQKRVLINLSRLDMRDVGGDRGATPADIAESVASTLAREAAKAVVRSESEQLLRDKAGDFLQKYLEK